MDDRQKSDHPTKTDIGELRAEFAELDARMRRIERDACTPIVLGREERDALRELCNELRRELADLRVAEALALRERDAARAELAEARGDRDNLDAMCEALGNERDEAIEWRDQARLAHATLLAQLLSLADDAAGVPRSASEAPAEEPGLDSVSGAIGRVLAGVLAANRGNSAVTRAVRLADRELEQLLEACMPDGDAPDPELLPDGWRWDDRGRAHARHVDMRPGVLPVCGVLVGDMGDCLEFNYRQDKAPLAVVRAVLARHDRLTREAAR